LSSSYAYYPVLPTTFNPNIPPASRHTLTTSAAYVLERGSRQRLAVFDRSISLSYTYNQIVARTSSLMGGLNYSITDYFMPSLTYNYSFQDKALYSANLGLLFQSPSQCWKLMTYFNFLPVIVGIRDSSITFGFDLQLNITGSGFGGMNELTSALAQH
jgi:hypothetical protein